jgi:DNA-binding winged helix-turn-helix (wHTH) protein
MRNEIQLPVDEAGYQGFEFDYNRNLIFDHGQIIRLTPHEADILQVLLSNRGRATPMGTLIQRVYGAREPDSAAISIRVAVHSLRKKIKSTQMTIRAEPVVGYELDASRIPDLNRRLIDKIAVALNLAHANEEMEIVRFLEEALSIAARKRLVRVLAPAYPVALAA